MQANPKSCSPTQSKSSVGNARVSMSLTLEAYRRIVNEIGSRKDLAVLCRTSKGFQNAAERALYNTLHMRTLRETFLLCRTLSTVSRISALVDALTIYATAEEESADDLSDSEDEEPNYALPSNYWPSIAKALAQTTNLRYLNIHITNSSNANAAWILDHCTFQLRTFHCDLNWDGHLVSFLNKQSKLDDLYLIDYIDADDSPTPMPGTSTLKFSSSLDKSAFRNLSTLECTFSEAAVAIAPGRPLRRLKTCFSRTQLEEKRAEMRSLMSKIRQSARPLYSLDIADSSYTETFSMELLSTIVNTETTSSELRYLGTLVLPISGKERLQFYGLVMRLPRIQCVELEVSEWVPPPSSPAAFRALAGELRLYAPSVKRVIFVHDFDRVVVTVVDGICRVAPETNSELLWREL